MREAMFIKKNAEKWKRYQEQAAADPDETAERFITLMDDLAFAKTFYPKSKATKWINGLAASVYQNLYRNKKEKYSRLFTFWKFELPLIVKKYHRIFLFTAVIFLIFTVIGAFSAAKDPTFLRGVMGDRYVDMTEDNIAKGDPFGVYKDENPFNMFIRIAFNNIKVAFFMFMSGITAGIFTMRLLWSNGIMLGSFHEMFVANGLGIKSILVVWIHGTIEIASIIIAGASGFMLANGLLFPGTYTRGEAFKRSASDAAKVLISLIPFFIIAAFLESYITHQMSETFDRASKGGMPVWASVLILALSAALIIWYFVIWPIKLHKKGLFIKSNGIVERLQNHDA